MGNELEPRSTSAERSAVAGAGESRVGKQTLVSAWSPPERATSAPTTAPDDKRAPDLTPIQIEGQLGNVRIKGALKFDSKNNGAVTIRSEGETVKNKLELGSVEGAIKTSMKGTQATITTALLNETFYLSKFPPPLDNIQPKLTGKVFDSDGSLDGTKLLTVGFAVEGQLPDSLLPEWARPHYKLVIEVAVELAVTPADLETIGKMRGMVDEALEAGRDVIKYRDKVAGKKTIIEGLVKEKAALEAARKAGQFSPTQQSRLAKVMNQLRFWESELTAVQGKLAAARKIFEALHARWLKALGSLSPLLSRFRGPVVEKLCVRLLPLIGKAARVIHPFLLIVMTIIDIAHLAKFLYDLYNQRLTYVGLGGDYEPDLLDWSDGRSTGKTGVGDGDGATPEPATDLEKSRKRIDALGGPRTRLAEALLHRGMEESLQPRHFDRLIAILASVEVTDVDVAKILIWVEPGMSPDKALDGLEDYFRRRDATTKRSPRPTDTEGGDGTSTRTREPGGGGDKDGDGDGDGDGGGGRRELLGARLSDRVSDRTFSGGKALPWSARGDTAVVVIGRSPDGGSVTVSILGKVTVANGAIEFRALRPGVHEVTTTERRWNPEQRAFEVVEGQMLLDVPVVISKPIRAKRKR